MSTLNTYNEYNDLIPKVYAMPEQQNAGDTSRFLQAMFSEIPQGTHQAFALCAARKHPGFATDRASFIKAYQANQNQRAYIGTATVTMGELNGKPRLRNMLEHFSALHFVVLDDIGTKCPAEKLPEALRHPTSIVESSAGNFQYGYKLETPITDKDEAREFVCNLYSAGPWDGGGALATKYVRLPCGVHGKTTFNVGLVELHPERVFTPQMMLEAAGYDPSSKAQRIRRTARRTAVERGRETVSMEGIVDPLLELMNQAGMVVYDGGEWVNIVCPWHLEHTDHQVPDNQTAGYRPIGRGGAEWDMQRGFCCHHDHCSHRTTRDFLTHMQERFKDKLGKSELTTTDNLAPLVRDYAYCMEGDAVVDLRDNSECKPVAFGRAHCLKMEQWSQHPLWQVAKLKERRPDKNDILFKDKYGRTILNSFTRPEWERVAEVDLALLQPWFHFTEYLFPIEEEREYVLNWMAQKLQDIVFRGAVLMCVAEGEGTGRGTFWDMFRELVGPWNTSSPGFKDVIGGWDDHLRSLLAVVVEASDDSDTLSRFTASDTLKRKCDPAAQLMDLNVKSKAKETVYVCTSTVLCTNNADAMRMNAGSRRLYVVTNPHQAKDADYFSELYLWTKKTEWQRHLYTWLMDRDLSDWDGYAPAPMTVGKHAMMEGTDGLIGALVRKVLEVWPAEYIARVQMTKALDCCSEGLELMTPKWKNQVMQEFKRGTLQSDRLGQVGGVDRRPKVDVRDKFDPQKKATCFRIRNRKTGKNRAAGYVDWTMVDAHVQEVLIEWG